MRDARRRGDGFDDDDDGLRHGRLLDGEMRFLAAGEALEGFAVVVDDLDLGGDELDPSAERPLACWSLMISSHFFRDSCRLT